MFNDWKIENLNAAVIHSALLGRRHKLPLTALKTEYTMSKEHCIETKFNKTR